jgi:GNAT superfamily N-acetyltransferase
VELRPTTVDDLPELHRIFVASIGSVYRPRRLEPPAPPPEIFAEQQGHVIDTGYSLVAVARGRLLGYGSAWTRGSNWFLASLFIAPSAQGRGVGTALLDAVWDEEAVHRRTITDAIQPVSNMLYGRRGLIPTTPLLTFTGTPAIDAAAEPADAVLADVDAAAYGFDRAVDHVFWERHARRTTWPGAYSYVFRNGAIGPVGGVDPAAAAAALASELARAGGPVLVRIPGSSRVLVEVALRAGLRLGGAPGLLLLSAGTWPPESLAISGYTLA